MLLLNTHYLLLWCHPTWMLPSKTLFIYLGTIYILCAIYLNIIEIYVYFNKFGPIACYLAHKEIPSICINLLFCIFYTSCCLERHFGNKYSLKTMSITNVLVFFCPTQIREN